MIRSASLGLAFAAAALLASPRALGAQNTPAAPPRVAFGAAVGSSSWADGHAEQAAGAVLQIQPVSWLLFGANPMLVRTTDAARNTSRIGLTDLPVFAGVVHTFAAAWRPTVGIAGSVTLPVGDSASGFGRGSALGAATLAAAVSPLRALTLRLAGTRVVREPRGTPAGLPRSAIAGDAVVATRAGSTISLGGSAELGAARNGYTPVRTISAALTVPIGGSTTLMLGGAHTLRGVGPDWLITIGIGSAFAGIAPVGAMSPVSRAVGGATGNPLGGGWLSRSPLCGVGGGC